MTDRKEINSIFKKHKFTDFKWINPRHIVTAEWVRMKYMFGCASFGQKTCCPPNVPQVPDCRRFFDEFKNGVIFHFNKTVANDEDNRNWSRKTNEGLLSVEREIFLQGYYKAFLIFMSTCRMCEECTGIKQECKNPKSARPTPESLGVDVYSTVRKYKFPIKVLTDYSEEMNKYAILLID